MKNQNSFKKLNRLVQFLVLMLVLAPNINSQTLMYYWNFNQSVPASGVNWTAPITDTIHNAQLTYTMANAVSFGGTTFNAATGDVVNGGSFCPTGGTSNANNGTYLQLNIPTTGYSGISISYAARKTSTGFSSQEIQYTINGTDWITKETKDLSTYGNNWVVDQIVTIDFSAITTVNDNANFAIRIKFNGATAESGNNRIDNIKVTGNVPSVPHAVNFSVVGTNGTLGAKVDNVDITSGDLVQSGKNVVFTASPAVGYRVKEWKLNSVVVSSNTSNSFTITNLQEASTVSVEFEVAPSYIITYSVIGANGTLAATVDAGAITTGTAVESGKTIVFTAAPDALYQVKQWKVNNSSVAGNTTNNYSLVITSDTTVMVEFELIPVATGGLIISQYIETYTGTTPKGIELWNKTGAEIDFSVTNLFIKQGTNGVAPVNIDTINTGVLANNAVIVIGTSDLQTVTEGNGATFKEKAFTFNGDDALEIWLGTDKQDVFGTPGTDPGTAWVGNGVSTANQNISLKLGIITGSLTGWTDPSLRFDTTSTLNSTVGFGLAPIIPIYHAVNFSVVGTNGTILASVNSTSINSGDTIAEGNNIVFTATPAAGYRVKEWTLNTTAISGNTSNTYTLTNLTQASTVTVEFEVIPTFAVTFSVIGTNGSISASIDGTPITSGDLIDAGKNIIFTATPAAGYRVKEWKLNSTIIAGNTTNTDTLYNIQAISDVTVEFEIIPTYAVTFSVVGANGTISANVDATAITSGDLVQAGKNIQLTATPAIGYQVKEWTINSVVVAENTNTSLDIANIQEAKTVTVEFELIPTYTVTFTVKNSSAVDITNAVVTFNGVVNAAGNYVFSNVSAGTYTYSIAAPGYLPLNNTNIDISADITEPVVLQDLPAPATLPLFYSGPWQTGLPTGWSQTGLGADYSSAGAKFDGTADELTVNFDSSPDSLIYTIKANTGGTSPWSGTFDIMESVDGETWTSVKSYSAEGSIPNTDITERFKISSDSRWVRWIYTSKGIGNVQLDNVYITKVPNYYPVNFSVVNANGNVSATVDGTTIASGDTVQEGKNVVFTAVPSNGYRVKEWKNNNIIVSGVTTNTYTLSNLIAAANVTVEFELIPTYTVDFSVVGVNGTLSATVDGTPITTGATVQEGKNVVFTAVPNAHFMVKEWTVNSIIVSGNTSNNYTLSNISASATVNVEFKVDVTGINSTCPITVNVYPNPSTGIFNLVSDSKYSIEVVDILGKTILSQEIQKGQTAINLSSFHSGIYFVRFTNESNSYVVKIKKTN